MVLAIIYSILTFIIFYMNSSYKPIEVNYIFFVNFRLTRSHKLIRSKRLHKRNWFRIVFFHAFNILNVIIILFLRKISSEMFSESSRINLEFHSE